MMMTQKRAVSPGTWSFVWKSLILAIALLVNVTLGVRLFWGPQSLANYHHLKEQQAALTARLNEQDTVNAALSREIRLLQNDDRYIEKMIRQRLNYVKEKEILYLFTPNADANSTGATQDAGKN